MCIKSSYTYITGYLQIMTNFNVKNTASTYLGLEILIRRCNTLPMNPVPTTNTSKAKKKKKQFKKLSQLIVIICIQMDERWFQTTIPLLSKPKN